MTILFTWLFNHTQGSVLYSLLFHASMSAASTRLPEMPAYPYWVLSMLLVVLAIVVFDHHLGQPRPGQSSDEASSGG